MVSRDRQTDGQTAQPPPTSLPQALQGWSCLGPVRRLEKVPALSRWGPERPRPPIPQWLVSPPQVRGDPLKPGSPPLWLDLGLWALWVMWLLACRGISEVTDFELGRNYGQWNQTPEQQGIVGNSQTATVQCMVGNKVRAQAHKRSMGNESRLHSGFSSREIMGQQIQKAPPCAGFRPVSRPTGQKVMELDSRNAGDCG